MRADEDAGPDAGSCNVVVNVAPAIVSACISTIPNLGGGALVAGTYHLVNVNALGSALFCQNRFIPTGFKETLVLTVDGAGVGKAETISQIAGRVARSRTTTFDPGQNDTSPMTSTQTCPPRAGTMVQYASHLRNNKQVLRMRLPYGQDEAIFVFEKQ
jgi:hypothetical protein